MAGIGSSEMSSAVRIVSGVATKPIRVDNWGNFLAQRIEALYDKEEHCDLTLRFPHGDLKAHSLVLHACTPFFTNLLKGKTTGPKILKMPPQISSSVMGIILKFVYTGRLEAPFSVDMLYSTAKLLKLQILIRLLEAQMNSAEASAAAEPPSSPSRRGRPPGGHHRPRGATLGAGYQPTNSQRAARRTPVRAAEPPEDARPSRFEMPETDDLELRLPALEAALLRPKTEPRLESPPPPPPVAVAGRGGGDRETLFEHLRQSPAKRAASPPPPQENGAGKKRPKLEPADADRDVGGLREYYQEQRRRAQLLGEQGDGAAGRTDEPAAPEADWQGEEEEAEPPPPPPESPPPPATGATEAGHQTPATPVTPRPILKQEPTPAGSGKKRVQFSESPQLTLTVQDMGDTSELVSQLLKQHPEVLRGGQNIKVRLVTPAGPGSPSRSEFVVVKQPQQPQQSPHHHQQQQQRQLVGAAGGPSEPLETPLSCSLCAQKGRQADFWSADQMAKHFQRAHSDASAIDLNTLSCTTCVRAGDPIEFVTVADYFTHLREVHDTRGVRSASGVCQLCGFSADKKLQLIYHQYIKHKIRPPRFITFPKCDRCDFEAISDSEMMHHRQRRHKISKEYKCKDCGLLFPNLSLLEGHMRTNACRQGSDTKRKFDWKCEFCGMSFSRSYNLKGHMRSVHKMSVERRRVSQQQQQQSGQQTAVVKQEVTVQQLSAALDPSSEAESMSTVASSVAASLSLAVDGEYMALPDGIVPVEDENGMISYIALQPADADGGAGRDGGGGGGGGVVPDGAVLEVTEYTVPVVVRGDGGPGASAGETVLPDLASPRPPALETRTIDLPQSTGRQIARTLVSVPQLETPRGERRRTASPGVGSSRISVSSSEVTVSDLSGPGSILPHLPGEPLPAAVSQHYQPVSLGQLQHGQLVMADGMTAGHVIVSELPSGQEVIVADIPHGQLYELQQPAEGGQQQLIAHTVQVSGQHSVITEQQQPDHGGSLDGPDPRQTAEEPPPLPPPPPPQQSAGLSQPQEPGVSETQDVTGSEPQDISEPVLSGNQGESEPGTPGADNGSEAPATHMVLDVACDADQTQEMLVHSDEFIGPDTIPGDADMSDARGVQNTCGAETGEPDDGGESGQPAAGEADMSVQQYDQSTDVSDANISTGPEMHSVVDESVAHYPAAEEVVSQEQADSEMDESVAHYPAGEEAVVSDQRSDGAEEVTQEPYGGGETALSGGTVTDDQPAAAARSPEQRHSPAAGDHPQLVLVTGQQVVVPAGAAVVVQEVVTEQQQPADSPGRPAETAPDPGDARHQVLPPAGDGSAPPHHV